MPFIPTPNCVQADLVYDWNGQVCQNVLHYVKASPWLTTHMEELAENLKDIWDAQIKAVVSSTLLLSSIRVTDLSSETGAVINYSLGLPIAGTDVSPSLPNNCAIVITKRTLLRGRSYRGRLYHCGLTEANVVGNTVNSGVVSGLVTRYSNFISVPLTVAADEALLTVLSLVNGGVDRANGVATLVNNLTSDGVLDSQRRRLPGRGQ